MHCTVCFSTHVLCVCVCCTSVCVERRSLNESRLSGVCHCWLLTSSPLLWADCGQSGEREGGRGGGDTGSCHQPRCARPWQCSYSSPLLPTACWASDLKLSAPRHQPSSRAALPTCPASGQIHTHTHTYTHARARSFVCFIRKHHNGTFKERE